MSALSLASPFPIFTDIDGDPLDSGYIYVGEAGLNAETNPLQVFWDAALTVPAAQPIRTLNGYPSRNGAPAVVYMAESDASIIVKNKNGSLVFSTLNQTTLSRADSSSVLFLQSGTGAVSSTTERKLQEFVSVLDFMTPAQIDDVISNTGALNLFTPIQAAVNSFGGGYTDGHVHFPAGTYKWTGAITVPGRISISGDGVATKFNPTTDGFIFLDNAAIGGTFVRDFYMTGASIAASTGLSFVPGTDATKWLQGAKISDVVVSTFLTGIQAKNLRHSVFNHVSINACFKGISVFGQAVSNTIDACKIVSGTAVYNDGSIGVEVVATNTYSDAISRQPEALKIIGETLVYGFDTNLYVKDCLNFLCDGNDLDAGIQYGVRVANATGGFGLKNNYIGMLHQVGSVVKGIFFNDLAAPVNTPIWVVDNHLQFYGAVIAGSTAMTCGTNRSGIFKVSGNMLGGGNAAAIALDLYGTHQNAVFDNNFIYGTSFSLVTAAGSIGHQFIKNQFIGAMIRPLANSGLDYFERNTGTETTCYHGFVTIPGGAGPATISLASLGILTNPVVGANAFLYMRTQGYQANGATNRLEVRARYDNAGNIIVDYTTAFGGASADIWVDMEAT